MEKDSLKIKTLFVVTTTLLASAPAGAATLTNYVDACLSSSNLNRTICECAGNNAQTQPSPKGFEFLVANLNQDDETTTKLRGELPLPEIMAAGMFMAKGPAKCARKLGGQ